MPAVILLAEGGTANAQAAVALIDTFGVGMVVRRVRLPMRRRHSWPPRGASTTAAHESSSAAIQ